MVRAFCNQAVFFRPRLTVNSGFVSNNPVTFVTHEHFAALFFLPSCCVNSLRSLLSQRLQGKTPLCGPFFENLHFLSPECLKRRKKTFSFQNYQDTRGRTLDQTSPFSLFLLRMTEIVTTWRERRIGQWQTGNRKAPSQSHLPLCFPANSTPILA